MTDMLQLALEMLKTSKLRQEIIEAARFLASSGYLPATSGNLSMREIGSQEITITLSGKSKAKLTETDFLDLKLDESNPEILKLSSAETELHRQLYKFSGEINAVFHIHSNYSVLISKIFKDEVKLENYELLKALSGNTTHRSIEIIPIFQNTQNINSLAKEVEQYMRNNPEIHAYLIEGHGLYTWGKTQAETLRHIEALEALFEIEIKYQTIKGQINDDRKNLS